MDPVTLAMLLGTGATVAKQLPAILPSKYGAEERNRLEQLLRKQSAGELGLTDDELRIMQNRVGSSITAAGQAAQNERNRLLAGSGVGVGGGAALLQAQLADEQKTRAMTEAGARVEEADMLRRQQQEEDILALRASIADRRANRMAALGNVAATAIEAYNANKPLDKMMASVAQLSPEEQAAFNKKVVDQMSTNMKLTPEKSEQLLQTFQANPELAAYYRTIGGK